MALLSDCRCSVTSLSGVTSMFLTILREETVWSRSTIAMGILVGTPSLKSEEKNKMDKTGSTNATMMYSPREDIRFISRTATSQILDNIFFMVLFKYIFFGYLLFSTSICF